MAGRQRQIDQAQSASPDGKRSPRQETPARTPAEAQAFLASIVESSDDAIISRTLEGVITSWNAAAQRLFEYTAEEAVGQSITMLIPPDRLEEEELVLSRLRRGESIEHYETVRLARSGRSLEISLTVSPMRDSSGRIIGASKIARDITARKRAQRESEQRFRKLADSAPVLIWMSDEKKQGVYFNQPWLDFTGKPLEAQLGDAWLEAVHPNDRSDLADLCFEAFRRQEPFTTQFRLRSATGEYRWMLDTGMPRFDADGILLGYIGTCVDIDDRKNAEEELRRREELFRAIFEASGVGIVVADPATGRFLQVNRKFCEITGYSAEELLELTFPELTHPEDREDDWRAYCDAIERNASEYSVEKRYVCREGQVIWVRIDCAFNRNPRGTAIYDVAVVQDITDRKQAELALFESESRFRLLADNIAQLAWMADETGAIFWYNKRWFDYTGTTPEEMEGLGWRKLHHPDHVEQVTAKFKQHIEAGKFWEDTFPLRGADGEYRWFLSRALPICDEHGRIFRWLGTNTDITRQLEVERALREAKAEADRRAIEAEEGRRVLDAMMEHIPMGITIADAPDVYIRAVSRWGRELTGQPREHIEGIPAELHSERWQFYHADGVTPAGSEELPLTRATRNGDVIVEEEFMIVGALGRRIPILCTAGPIRDRAGNIIGGVIGWQDISERKRHEAQMQLVMAELNHRVKNTLAAVEATAKQTMRHSRDAEQFTRSFGVRLRAMATVHSLLTNTQWEGTALRDLISAELDSRIGSSDQVLIDGPPLVLLPNAALSLHMVIHELATNAAKYGALSRPDGSVTVRWRLDHSTDHPMLQLQWIERGGPPVEPPKHHGFGSNVVQQTIQYELSGSTDLQFPAHGVECRISFPWSDTVGHAP